MSKPRKEAKKNKKLVSMSRKELVSQGNHGAGKADPTKGLKAAGPGAKMYQVG